MEDLVDVRPIPRAGKRKNPFRPDGFGGKVFDFFSSLRLAVILLAVMGIVCIAGTIAESNYTARLAQRLVYKTVWFDFLICAIFSNVLFATLARYPWRISQVGFLITHLGVLTLLTGALISHRFGLDGQLMLNEGQAKDRIQLSNSFIGIQEAGADVRHRFDTVEVEWGKPSREKPQVYEVKDLGLKAIVDNFYPDSEWGDTWRDNGPEENPAIHFAIDNTAMGRMAEGWLAPRMPSNRTMELGPASIVAKAIPDSAALENEMSPQAASATSELGSIEVKVKDTGKTALVDVTQAMKGLVPVPGTDYSILVREQLPAGYLNEAQVLANAPDRAPNPVVIFDIYKGTTKLLDRQIEFANFPDFDMMHDQEQIESPFDTVYRPSRAGTSGGAEFAFLIGPGDELHWKVTSSTGQTNSGPIVIGQPVPMPMMTAGMNLLVDQQLKRAWRDESLVSREIKKGDFGAKAAHMCLSDEKGNQMEFWQQVFEPQEVALGGKKYEVVYQNDEKPLGFAVQLLDFRLIHYPGSEGRPMSFESDVKLLNLSGTLLSPDKIKIMMNEPLDHDGYRIFQSSYIDQPKGNPKISIFSVARDPGIAIIYTGAIILCLGIATMFYFKPYLRKLESRWQTATREVTVS
jgi:hypothetical protein